MQHGNAAARPPAPLVVCVCAALAAARRVAPRALILATLALLFQLVHLPTNLKFSISEETGMNVFYLIQNKNSLDVKQ